MSPEAPSLTSTEQIRALWSRTTGADGKPDWSHLFPYYNDDVVFQDSVQTVRGKEAFEGVCRRLVARCERLDMDIVAIAMDGPLVFMQWEMTMSFRRTPTSTVYGCTRLTLDAAGRVVHQRDYYDLWGDIFDNIPGVARLYRRFMHRLFG